MRPGFVLWIVLTGCASPAERPTTSEPNQPREKVPPAMSASLPPALEAELDAIRRDPAESVGFGEKADTPYEPNRADTLIASDDPRVTERLLTEARAPGDRTYRLAVLHVLGKRADPTVDAALIALIDDADLRATAAYLLGRAGYRGYPARARDAAAVRAALRRYVGDTSTFTDPFYRRAFRTQDFVIGAYVRVTGPEKFHLTDEALIDLIGRGLPALSDATRAALLAQIASGL